MLQILANVYAAKAQACPDENPGVVNSPRLSHITHAITSAKYLGHHSSVESMSQTVHQPQMFGQNRPLFGKAETPAHLTSFNNVKLGKKFQRICRK